MGSQRVEPDLVSEKQHAEMGKRVNTFLKCMQLSIVYATFNHIQTLKAKTDIKCEVEIKKSIGYTSKLVLELRNEVSVNYSSIN